MEQFLSPINLKFWFQVIATVTVTTLIFGPLLRRQENARWTIGWFIPFFWGYFQVTQGNFDFNTWLSLFFAVGFCGAIKVLFGTLSNSLQSLLLRWIDRTGNWQALAAWLRKADNGRQR